jgi:hypothetical protein
MKLYRVHTIVKKFHGYQNVPLDWFGCDRREPRPYAELIEGYWPSDLDQEVAIDASPHSKRSCSKNISIASMAAQG